MAKPAKSLRQIKRTLLAVLAVGFLLAAPAKAVHQRTNLRCGDAASMKKILTEKWGEYPVATGLLTNNGRILVWYANDKTGTWSVVSFSPQGIGCLLGAGGNFNRFKKPKPKPKGKRA